jgi:hypothetical protein
MAAAAAGFFWQPVAANPKTTNTAIAKMRFKTIVLALSLVVESPTAVTDPREMKL